MLDKLLKEIYKSTYSIIANKIGDSEENHQLFYKYIISKYAVLIKDAIAEEGEEVGRILVKSFITDEAEYLSSLTKNQILSLLIEDPAFDRLQILSTAIFEQAKECLKTGIRLDNDNEYREQLKSIEKCVSKLKEHNKDTASELVTGSILDLDYIYNKSNFKSLRLSNGV